MRRAERLVALRRQVAAGRGGMAAETLEQVAAFGERRRQVEPWHAARGSTPRLDGGGEDDAGTPCSSARRPATSPMMPTGHGPLTTMSGGVGTPTARGCHSAAPLSAGCCLVERSTRPSAVRAAFEGRGQHLAAQQVGLLERLGQRVGLRRFLGEQQRAAASASPMRPIALIRGAIE